MAPKPRKMSEGDLPVKRQRKVPSSMVEYHCEPVIVISKPSPAKKDGTKPAAASRSHSKSPSRSHSKSRPASRPTAAASSSPTRRSASAAAAQLSSSSSAAEGAPIDIMALWEQIWDALKVVLICTVAVYVGNELFELAVKKPVSSSSSNRSARNGVAPMSLADHAKMLGYILAWVSGITALPFVAVSVIVQYLNVAKFGSHAQQGLHTAMAVSVVGLTAWYIKTKGG